MFRRTKSGDSKKRPNSVATTLPEDRYQRSYSSKLQRHCSCRLVCIIHTSVLAPVLQDANTASSVEYVLNILLD